jgi:UDP-N-acetylmuramoyl-tripeptide--D-alanyl-D-alanine ligase
MRNILQYILKFLAIIVLWKYKPVVVAVTGSVGKTSTKEAIYTVLKSHFRVRRNMKNYNNEIGVPLTILGLETGGRSISQWLKNFYQALKMIFWKVDYPEILILEMGADKPGDIRYLVSFVPVKIGVVTAIGQFPVHIEFFPERDKLIEEKATLIKSLPKDGLAILNYDDLSVRMMRENVPPGAKIISYGFGEGADAQLSSFACQLTDPKKTSISFKIEYQGSIVPFRISKALGKQQAYAAGAAAAVGLSFGLNLVNISTALKKYRSCPGRTNLIEGIKQTWIIDDTYNASPTATIAALEILNQFEGRRKIAVLGDMLELGQYTEAGHREVGQKATSVVDLLFTVGERARFIADEARKNGLSKDKVFEFSLPEEAGLAVQEKLEPKDVVLVKGSRAMRMEKIVKEIMARPEKAEKLLVQ